VCVVLTWLCAGGSVTKPALRTERRTYKCKNSLLACFTSCTCFCATISWVYQTKRSNRNGAHKSKALSVARSVTQLTQKEQSCNFRRIRNCSFGNQVLNLHLSRQRSYRPRWRSRARDLQRPRRWPPSSRRTTRRRRRTAATPSTRRRRSSRWCWESWAPTRPRQAVLLQFFVSRQVCQMGKNRKEVVPEIGKFQMSIKVIGFTSVSNGRLSALCVMLSIDVDGLCCKRVTLLFSLQKC
jgi:hypothetical protein